MCPIPESGIGLRGRLLRPAFESDPDRLSIPRDGCSTRGEIEGHGGSRSELG